MRVKVSDEMAAKVAELHGGGKSIRALAAEFGVPRSTIGSILNRQQPALVQTATEESPVEVGTTVPSMIAQQDASDFLNTISATVPAATDADPKNEVKRQQQLTQLTESLLGKPTVPTPINRKMRMPSKPANEEEFDKLLEGLLDGKAPKKPKEKRSEAPPLPQQQLPDASELLAPVPAPSKADLITQITLNVGRGV
jgi:lambda repressor-like predicted transcriptional regulator